MADKHRQYKQIISTEWTECHAGLLLYRRWMQRKGESKHGYCSCGMSRKISPENHEFLWLIFRRYAERRGDKLNFSFAVCTERSKQRVMMQGRLGDCGSHGTCLFIVCKVVSVASVIRKSQNLSYTHPPPLIYDSSELYFIAQLWPSGTWRSIVYISTCAETHTCMSAYTHTHIVLDQRKPWKEARRQDSSALLYPSFLL